MTEFKKADTNGDGVIQPLEWEKLRLEERRLEINDRDLKRDAERRYTGFALAGMLIYPFIILLASVLGFDKAASLITDIASVYVIAASGVVAAFMGFNAYSAKSDKKTSMSIEGEK
tara:strand:+ start:1234 stop:1581 length:348 start_codon:yes stop_codon:yes gene_type:complete